MKSMTLIEIAQAYGGTLAGGPQYEQAAVSAVKIDSRETGPGDLFVAVVGENHDAHKFLPDVYTRGAVCAVVDREIAHEPYIRVDSTNQALKDIAEYYRGQMRAKVVAVTGSVGKTTAKEMIAAVLAEKYNVLKTTGNFNNEFGVPQVMFMLEESHEIAVVELGMSGFGEIRSLSKITRPDACVIMNIGESHIGNLGSREGILKAKCEIFDYCKPGAPAFINGDDTLLKSLNRENTITFGKSAGNDASLTKISHADLCGTRFAADVLGKRMALFIPKPGEYLVYPALCAAAIGKHFGLNAAQIARGIEAFVPADMRMDIIETGKLTVINDVYNACKASILAGADTLRFAQGRSVAVVGDILELGEFSQRIHFETGQELGRLGIELIICVGDHAMYMAEGAQETSRGKVVYFKSQDALFAKLTELIDEGDTVFVKASRGMKFEHIVEKLKAL